MAEEGPTQRLNDLLRDLPEDARLRQSHYRKLERLVAELAGLPPDAVRTGTVSEGSKNVHKPYQGKPGRQARLVIAVVDRDEGKELDALVRGASPLLSAHPSEGYLVCACSDQGRWRFDAIVVKTGSSVGAALQGWFPSLRVFEAGAAAVQSLRVGLTQSDFSLLRRYPGPPYWSKASVEDQQAFRDLRGRIDQISQYLGESLPVRTRVSSFTSNLNPNARVPTDYWGCLYPESVSNKSYAFQLTFIVSPVGIEMCFCAGSGTSNINDAAERERLEEGLNAARQRLALLRGEPWVAERWTSLAASGFSLRSAWRGKPDAPPDFSGIDEWLAHAASAAGGSSSVSAFLSEEEALDAGDDLPRLLNAKLEPLTPFFDAVYAAETELRPEGPGGGFLATMRRYQREGVVFQSAVRGQRYRVREVDDEGALVDRIDAREPVRVTAALYESVFERVREAGGRLPRLELSGTAAIRAAVWQGAELALSADRETVIDASDLEIATQNLIDRLAVLRVGHAHGQTLPYKQTVLRAVALGLEQGELSENKIEFDWLTPRFLRLLDERGVEATEKQAAYAFFHLTGDLLWMLCYRDPDRPLDPGNASPSLIRQRVSHATIEDTYWRVLQDAAGRRRILDELGESIHDVKMADRVWIFQANPDVYDLESAWRELTEATWLVRQHESEIGDGQRVFLWQSGPQGGLVAEALTLGAPTMRPMAEEEWKFVREGEAAREKFEGLQLRVPLRILRAIEPVLGRRRLASEPGLSNLSILRFPQGTNFPVTLEETAILDRLIAGNLASPARLEEATTAFAEATRECGLVYGPRHDEKVRTFLASLATKRFALLMGLSGSGKTQLALRLGEWFGPDRYRIVPVRPDWTGPESLFGFEDALLAVDPESGRAWNVPEALSFMLQAARHPSNPYCLILDEMNLAHVERYFADFLSGMESDEPCLPNLEKKEGFWRAAVGPIRLCVPDNLFVVGTVNVDETTYMFSPKVLDRANTLEFRVDTDELDPGIRKPMHCRPGDADLVGTLLAVARDSSWHEVHTATDRGKFIDALRNVHKLLAEFGFEFGHRVFFEAIRFASILEAMGEPDWRRALDQVVMQKLLPRLQGARRRLEPVLCGLGRFCFDLTFQPELVAGEASERFDPLGKDPSQALMPTSFEKLRRMLRTLRANQFAGFAE